MAPRASSSSVCVEQVPKLQGRHASNTAGSARPRSHQPIRSGGSTTRVRTQSRSQEIAERSSAANSSSIAELAYQCSDEFLEHYCAKVGHRPFPYDSILSLHLVISFALLWTRGTRKRPPQSGFIQTKPGTCATKGSRQQRNGREEDFGPAPLESPSLWADQRGLHCVPEAREGVTPMAHTATPTKPKSGNRSTARFPRSRHATRKSSWLPWAPGVPPFSGHAGRPQLFGFGSLMCRCLIFRGPNGSEERVGA